MGLQEGRCVSVGTLLGNGERSLAPLRKEGGGRRTLTLAKQIEVV